jgi:hypothetical protein
MDRTADQLTAGTTIAVTAVPCGGLDRRFGWAWRVDRTSVVIEKQQTPQRGGAAVGNPDRVVTGDRQSLSR